MMCLPRCVISGSSSYWFCEMNAMNLDSELKCLWDSFLMSLWVHSNPDVEDDAIAEIRNF